jgi:hypothetical protein
VSESEILDRIYTMCKDDELSETNRQKFYYYQAKGDPTAHLQYASTSHGRALQAGKIADFIDQHRPQNPA